MNDALRWLRTLVLPPPLLALACSNAYELPEEGEKGARFVVDEVGADCELSSGAPRPGELLVEDSDLCGERGACLGHRSESFCSCRCEAADEAAPTCVCPSGFECSARVSDLGLSSRELAGSYCAPVIGAED